MLDATPSHLQINVTGKSVGWMLARKFVPLRTFLTGMMCYWIKETSQTVLGTRTLEKSLVKHMPPLASRLGSVSRLHIPYLMCSNPRACHAVHSDTGSTPTKCHLSIVLSSRVAEIPCACKSGYSGNCVLSDSSLLRNTGSIVFLALGRSSHAHDLIWGV